MKAPRVRLTTGRLMIVVAISGVACWLTIDLWNREYTETALFTGWPATRASYTRTYGDRLLERLGLGVAHYGNWTPIPDPPPPARGFGMPELGDLMAMPAGSNPLPKP